MIVLIDPDNFLLEDISKFVPKVKKGQAYAQVLRERERERERD